MSKTEIMLTGSGGQGVILASVILAEAAVLTGKHAVQNQSYGPEARGGACRAEAIVSDDRIGFTKVQHPDLFVALTQDAIHKYASSIGEDCLLLVDESICVPEELANRNVVSLPIIRTAYEKTGKAITANIVAVGAINELLKLASDTQITNAVNAHIPKGLEKINRLALKEGMALVKKNG